MNDENGNHHFEWIRVHQLFLWPFSIAMLVITRGYLPLRAPLSHVQPQEAENGAIDEKEHEDHHEDLGNLTNSGAR